MGNAIVSEKLRFSYPSRSGDGKEEVLHGIDAAIEEGTFVAILGHNGSGKSTFAKHFNAILLPDAGNISVFGMDTKDEALLLEIRRRVGLVFQNPDNQIVASIVEEDVAFAPENLGIVPDEIRKRVDDALALVGMSEYTRHAPHLLSGGQKQRIAIAGVIAMHPKCVVFDEATAMLDPQGRRETMETIKLLRRELNTTVVLITHHMEEAAQADRVIVMKGGEIALDGTPREIFSQVEKMRELEMDVPEGTALIYELNKAGFDIAQDMLYVDECADAIAKALAV